MFGVPDDTADEVVAHLHDQGVLVKAFGPSTIRATTHRDVSMEAIEQAVDALHAYADRAPRPEASL
jgi:threonine aldolase